MSQDLTTKLVALNQAFEDDVAKIVNIITTAIGIISMIGCLYTIVATLTIRVTQNNLGKTIVYASLMEIICSIPALMNFFNHTNNMSYQAQGFMIGFGRSGSIFWLCCIAHSVYLSVIRNDMGMIGFYMKRYQILSVPVAVSSGLTSLFSEFYQPDTRFSICSHLMDGDGFDVSELLTLTVPVLIGIFFCSYCCIAAMRNLRMRQGETYKKLLLYPIFLMISNLPLAILDLYLQITSSSDVPMIMLLIGNVLFYFQGIFVALSSGLLENAKNCRRKPSEYSTAGSHSVVSVDTELSTKQVSESRNRDMTALTTSISDVPQSF